MRRILIALAAFLLAGLSAFAESESFYVKSLQKIKIDRTAQTEKAALGHDSALILDFSECRAFLSEIEVEVKVPQEIAESGAKFSYAFFSNANVEQGEAGSTQKIFAERILSENFPSQLSVFFKIPIAAEYAPQESTPYAKIVSASFSNDAQTVLFAIFPPENYADFADLQFEALVRPVLAPRGFLSLKLDFPEDEKKPVRLSVDDAEISDWSEPVELPEGEYHAVVSSDFFRTEVRYFVVEKGKTTSLRVALRDIKPRVILSAPDGVAVFLDGKAAKPFEEIVVDAGVHEARFSFGGFEIVRQVMTISGKSYTLSCDIDVLIDEND